MVPSGLRSGPVACLAAGLVAEASMKSLPLPLETTTGALDAALLQSGGETPLNRVRPALAMPPQPDPSATRTCLSPLLRRKQMIML